MAQQQPSEAIVSGAQSSEQFALFEVSLSTASGGRNTSGARSQYYDAASSARYSRASGRGRSATDVTGIAMANPSRTKPPYSWLMLFACISATLCVACNRTENGKSAFGSSEVRPDVLPVMLNKELPFRYPPALYAEKAQGNVTLRLYASTRMVVIAKRFDSVWWSRPTVLQPSILPLSKGRTTCRFCASQSCTVFRCLCPYSFRYISGTLRLRLCLEILC